MKKKKQKKLVLYYVRYIRANNPFLMPREEYVKSTESRASLQKGIYNSLFIKSSINYGYVDVIVKLASDVPEIMVVDI